MTERTTIVHPGQCLEDIALQEYGSIDAVGIIVFGNEDVFVDGFSTDLDPGTTLRLPGEPLDKAMHDTMRRLQVVPATVTEEAVPLPDEDFNDDFNDDFNSALD